MKQRVLFVCLGNICRSPAAQGVLRERVAAAGKADQIEVLSAGTAGYHVGHLPDARMRSAAAQRGYQLDSHARQVEPRDLREFDLVIAMDRDNYRDLMRLGTGRMPHVRLLSDFLDADAPRDVPDPYYGGLEGFETVLDMLETAAPNILRELEQMKKVL